MKNVKHHLILFILSSFMACSNKTGKAPRTDLGIRVPIVSRVDSITAEIESSSAHTNSGLWGLVKPVSLSEIDCFAIGAYYPEGDKNSCKLLEGGEATVDELFGSVKGGEILRANIKSGKSRKIQVIGFATHDGSCPKDIAALTKVQMKNSSAPLILGETEVDVEGDEMEVEVSISMDNPIALNDCIGESFSWEESNPKSTGFSIHEGFLTVTGENLGSAREARVVDPSGNETKLAILSKNHHAMALKARSSLNLAMNTLYELFISNAYGEEVFNITVGGNAGYNIVNVTSDYSVSSSENQSLFLVNGKHTLVLPSVADAGAGFNIIIKSIGDGFDGVVRVQTATGEKIDVNYENLILRSKLATVNLTSDGSQWWMLSSNGTIDPVETFYNCDNTTCYSGTYPENAWAIHSTNGEIMHRYSSGDIWRVIFAENSTGVWQDKYLIDDYTNSTNSGYIFTKYWDVAKHYDALFMGTFAGKTFGVPEHYLLDSVESLNNQFHDEGINLSEHDGSSSIPGHLNSVSFTGSHINSSCHRYGGRLISQSDSGLPALSNGKTYWTADASNTAVNSYLTWDADTAVFSANGEDHSNGHYLLCIWDDIEAGFALE
ncbi:MAG: hypothetical protein CME63_16025 [Halobacteriovoraceae bacterium]|nr:hypothetical protein [Halobacteriovoraceae bacterium]